MYSLQCSWMKIVIKLWFLNKLNRAAYGNLQLIAGTFPLSNLYAKSIRSAPLRMNITPVHYATPQLPTFSFMHPVLALTHFPWERNGGLILLTPTLFCARNSVAYPMMNFFRSCWAAILYHQRTSILSEWQIFGFCVTQRPPTIGCLFHFRF